MAEKKADVKKEAPKDGEKPKRKCCSKPKKA